MQQVCIRRGSCWLAVSLRPGRRRYRPISHPTGTLHNLWLWNTTATTGSGGCAKHPKSSPVQSSEQEPVSRVISQVVCTASIPADQPTITSTLAQDVCLLRVESHGLLSFLDET